MIQGQAEPGKTGEQVNQGYWGGKDSNDPPEVQAGKGGSLMRRGEKTGPEVSRKLKKS